MLNHYLEVLYEDLLRNPEAELKRICDFIELPFKEEMLRYSEGFQGRDPNHQLISPGPDVSRIADWQNKMSPDDIREYESIAGLMLKELGYDIFQHQSKPL